MVFRVYFTLCTIAKRNDKYCQLILINSPFPIVAKQIYGESRIRRTPGFMEIERYLVIIHSFLFDTKSSACSQFCLLEIEE